MKVEVFGKQNCGLCTGAKSKVAHILERQRLTDKVALEFIDMDTVDGMAEGAFNDVLEVPTTILRSASGEPLARWEKCVPLSTEVLAYLASPGAPAAE